MGKSTLQRAEWEQQAGPSANSDTATSINLPPSYTDVVDAGYSTQRDYNESRDFVQSGRYQQHPRQYRDDSNSFQRDHHSEFPSQFPPSAPSPYVDIPGPGRPPFQARDRDNGHTPHNWTSQGHPLSARSHNASTLRASPTNQGTPQRPSYDADLLEQALLFTRHSATDDAVHTRLARPVVVPQVSSGIGKPFARAYSSALQSKGIGMQEFIEFIDNLNLVSTGSPPLQVLDLAGGVVGMVPHHIPQLVGNALSLTAKIGTAAVSKGRSNIFVNEANKHFFAPRSLKMEVVGSQVLKERLGLRADADLVAALDGSTHLSVQDRRILALEPYTSPLTFDVPPPTAQTNALERLSAAQVARQLSRSDKKALEDREKALRKSGGSGKESKADQDLEKELAKLEKECGKVEQEYEKQMAKVEKDRTKNTGSRAEAQCRRDADRAERKRQRDVEKLKEEREKILRKAEGDSTKDRRGARKDDKEIKSAEKLLWIFVEESSSVSEG